MRLLHNSGQFCVNLFYAVENRSHPLINLADDEAVLVCRWAGGRPNSCQISAAAQIADSVDMLDTGLDLSEAVNLIFRRCLIDMST